jgi:tol-pal system protein YbgF
LFIKGNRMKKSYLIPLCLSICAVTQADELPPVLDSSSYPLTAPPPVQTLTTPANSSYELISRIDRLQAEMQQLTGKQEELANQVAQLKQQQSKMNADFEERLRTLENKGGTPAPAAEVAPTPPAPVTETPVTIPPSPAIEGAAPTVSPKSVTPKAPEVQASGGEKQAYQQAYNSLRTGQTDQSISQFQGYLNKYPTGGYIDLAYYWLGEAYRVKPDANAARQAYTTVLEKYPNSTKTGEALLKLGYIEVDQKNTDKAREILTRVTTEYANTPAAHAAAKKLAQLK